MKYYFKVEKESSFRILNSAFDFKAKLEYESFNMNH